MTLLDWFAGQVAGGLAASDPHSVSTAPELMARIAHKMAAAMVVERDRYLKD